MDYSKSKYQNATAEQADAIINDGMADEQFGDVESGGHYALVTVEGRHVIVRTDSDGFVWIDYEETHHSIDHARIMSQWETLRATYEADEETEQPLVEPVRFTIGDDDRSFRGYSDGTTWNGWDQVFVTPQTRERIKAYIVDVLGPDDGTEQVADLDAMPLVDGYGGLVDMNGWTTITRKRENELRRLCLRAADRHARRLSAYGDFPAILTPDQDRMLSQAYALYSRLAAELDKLP